MNRFENKVAIVTGGAGGIGAAIASRLASEGATVVVSDVNLEAAQAVAQAIEAAGGKARAMAADIASGEACRGLVQAVASEFGRIDVLVNNAGINRRGNLLALTPMLEAGVLRSGRTIADLDRMVPFGRIGKPEEVASLVAFLASDEAAFMCGSLVEITGAQAVA